MVAIAIGEVHGLHHPVQAGGTVETQLGQGHGLEHLEQLHQGDPATTGGRHGEHRMVAESHLEGTHQLGPVALEIGMANQTAPLAHQGHQCLSDRALVEARLALVGDASQAGGKQGLAPQLGRSQGALKKQLAGGGV